MSSQSLVVRLRRYRSPQTVIGRFTVRRTIRSAAFLALVFGMYFASKSIGLASAYPSQQAREAAAAGFTSNTGLIALVGRPHDLVRVGDLAAWNTTMVMVMVGAIWGILVATKMLRGEEENGRWELLLTGQTTARRALCNVLAGLAISLSVLFVVSVAAFAAVGRMHSVGYSASSAVIFSLTIVSSIIAFASVGVLMSQLMPTRSRASSTAAAVFGVAFLVRALADVTNIPWLLTITPLGWAEKVAPIASNHIVWLFPLVTWSVILLGASVFLAGRRDLGTSVFADKDTAKPKLKLLDRPIAAAFRLTRANMFGWTAAMSFGALFLSLMAKTAGQAFSETTSTQHFLGQLTHATQTVGAKQFLGIVFFMLMILLMCFAASAIHAVRQDEAQGYLDNMLVRHVSRLGWATGRVALVAASTVGAALLASAIIRLGLTGQGLGISWQDILLSGVNMFAPVLFVLGIGVLSFGILPRFTSLIAYGVIAWSFLLQMISSGITVNHWILDTSIFQHIAFAPAASIRWETWGIFVSLFVALSCVGIAAFIHRDITTE